MKAKNSTKFADLHLHTKASDGTDSVAKTIEIAKKRGLNCIALTDHDIIHKELDFRSRIINGLEVINGSEIKAEIEGKKIEVLSYFLDASDPNIRDLTAKIEEYRIERMKKMVGKVNEIIDLEIGMKDVEEVSSGSIARPHLAKVLVSKGIVSSIGEAFQKYIGEGKPGYVRTRKLQSEEVIKIVHENGGVTSLAHPGRNLPLKRAGKLVSKLSKFGLDAIEVKYPYDLISKANSEKMKFGKEKAEELAEKYELLKTGGSDSHGTGSDKDFLGEIKVPYSNITALKGFM